MENKERKRILNVGGLCIVLGFMFGTFFGIYLTWDNQDYLDLQEDYDWLKESSIDCWNKLRLLDTACWSPTDCIENPELEGCKKIDCNWSCCKGKNCETTLIACSKLNSERADE